MALLIYAWFIPPVVAALIAGVGRGAAGSGFAPGLAFWGLVALAFVGVFWLAICFVFALPLSADLELGPLNALRTSFRVVSRHWFAVFGLTFVAGFLSMLGLAACIVGVFLTLPIFYAATCTRTRTFSACARVRRNRRQRPVHETIATSVGWVMVLCAEGRRRRFGG